MKTRNTNQTADIQGELLGMPYDFRRPTKDKIVSRVWNENGPLFPPKVWGMGWSLNLKHPAGPYVLFGILALPLTAILAALLSS